MSGAAPAVYAAISAVQSDLSKIGISKDGENTQQNYKFRGIDQVYAALSPLLAKHGLCVLPRMLSYDRTERVSMKAGYNGGPAKESVLFYVTVEAEFDFVAVSDGTKHTIRTYGEAMDSGDKATNKAMSAAYKYAAFMAFAIPTEGDNDADSTTHDVEPQRRMIDAPENGKARSMPPRLTGLHKTRAALKEAIRGFKSEIESCEDMDQFEACKLANIDLIDQVKTEVAFWWDGDGADFAGLAKDIEAEHTRIENMEIAR